MTHTKVKGHKRKGRKVRSHNRRTEGNNKDTMMNGGDEYENKKNKKGMKKETYPVPEKGYKKKPGKSY